MVLDAEFGSEDGLLQIELLDLEQDLLVFIQMRIGLTSTSVHNAANLTARLRKVESRHSAGIVVSQYCTILKSVQINLKTRQRWLLYSLCLALSPLFLTIDKVLKCQGGNHLKRFKVVGILDTYLL